MTGAEVARFLYREARLLDEKQWDAWYDLFTEDGVYWVPLTRGQPDAEFHTSLACEDRLLLRLRIERLRRAPPSQHPASVCQHVLQTPGIERVEDGVTITRTPFFYAESRGDEMLTLTGTVWHHLVPDSGGLKIRLKRVDLLNCDAALPSIQLFL